MKSLKFEYSFASHEKSRFWSSRNTKTSRNTSKNSHDKIWFNCDFCPHEFCKTLKTINLQNSWCPYCVNQALCNDYHCSTNHLHLKLNTYIGVVKTNQVQDRYLNQVIRKFGLIVTNAIMILN